MFQLNNSVPFFLVLSLQYYGIFAEEHVFKHQLEWLTEHVHKLFCLA